MFYRTSTLFITALGKLFNTKSSSCFDIINELSEQRKISENAKHKLSYAVAIACEIRLSVYLNEHSQRDYIQPHEFSETIFDKILEIVDKELIVSYFQITYCLQREVIKLLEIKGNLIYSNPTLMNITLCYTLKLDTQFVRLLIGNPFGINFTDLEQKNATVENNFFGHFDRFLESMEKEMKISALKLTGNPHHDRILLIYFLTSRAVGKDIANLEDKTELAMRLVEIVERSLLIGKDGTNMLDINVGTEFNYFVGITNAHIALMLIAMNRFDEAMTRMNRACEMVDETNNAPEDIASFYFDAGNNWIALKEFEKSINCFKIALGICLSVELYQFKDIKKGHVTTMFAGIGICLLKLNQYKESLIYLKTAAEMVLVFDTMSDVIPAELVYHSLGKCLLQLGHVEEGMPWLFRAVKLGRNGNLNVNAESDLVRTQTSLEAFCVNQMLKSRAGCLHDLGLLFMKRNDFKTAANYLQRSFNTYKKLFENKFVDEIRVKLLKCYMKIYQRKQYFLKILRICKISSKLIKVLTCFAKVKL